MNDKKIDSPGWKKYFSKRDAIIILCLLAVSVVLLIGMMIFRTKGGTVEITVAGREYGTFSLQENRTVAIQNAAGQVTNKLTIRNGEAYMSYADCPDHLCMHQGKIHTDGASIVCLPNKVVVTVRSQKDSDFDSVTN